MEHLFTQRRGGWWFVVIVALGAMRIGGERAEAVALKFEGYKVGKEPYVGAPSPGGGIGSQVDVTLGADPWFGTCPFKYMDGWNHAPRVPADQYDGINDTQWTPGGHAGAGTAVAGWASLDNANPGRYVLDFEGYVFERNFYYCEGTGFYPGDPKYGHEDRWYDGSTATWAIRDTTTGSTVASGTASDLCIDIFYDPEHAGQPTHDPWIRGQGTLTATNDGGAFYNELMSRWDTPDLDFTFACEDPPVQAENPYATNPLDMWAIYGSEMTVRPLRDAQPDWWIKQGANWLGDNVYNADGTDQTGTRTLGGETTAIYQVRLYNEGDVPEAFWIRGPVGQDNWGVRYYRGTAVDPDREVTNQVISAAGWRRTVPGRAYQALTIEVTRCPSTIGSFEALVTATSESRGVVDAIKAVTTAPRLQPDLWVKQGTNWLGDDVYNGDGDEQTGQRTVAAGATAVYSARLYNDGAETETFVLRGPAGDGDWAVAYYQGATDVTAQVTSAGGWQRRLAVGAYVQFTIKVTPRSGLASGSTRDVLVKAESKRDPHQRDALKAATKVR